MEDKFQQHKAAIIEAINRIAPAAGLKGDVTLVDGFVFNDIQKDTKNIIMGGQRIPLVALVDNSTGIVHYFALKVLLPNIEL